MATDRIGILKQMIEQNPGNSFAQYGLATEYANSGQYEEAVNEFEALLAKDQSYVAAYYHGGRALEKLGRIDAARAFYEKGIEASTKKGDLHARSELESALGLLPG
jgi:tetratricopeptide (TPR) repeat protein